MGNALNLIELTSKLSLELVLDLPQINDNLSTMDKELVPKVSSIRRFHCISFNLNNFIYVTFRTVVNTVTIFCITSFLQFT